MADYRQYFQAVLRPPSEHAAEDFFMLSGRYANFRKETCFIRCLSGSSYDAMVERLRRWEGDARALRLELPLEDAFLPGPEPTRFRERQEETQLVRQALLRLSPTDRDIFLRHYYWRQTVARIAEELGMNPSTVKSRLKRGREKLRNTLKKEDA